MSLRLAGVALAILVVLPVTGGTDAVDREDLAFSLAVVLPGLLMLIARRNAVSQIVGCRGSSTGSSPAPPGPAGCRSWSRTASSSRC